MEKQVHRISVKTKNEKVDMFTNCTFILLDRVLFVTEKGITYCYPLENVVYCEYKEKQ